MVYTEQIRNERAPVVCTRKNWADPWVVQERLYCLSCEFALGSIGTAQFIYHYGESARNDYVWEDLDPLELNNHWVKVTLQPTDPTEPAKNWYGIICMEELDIFGIDDSEQAGNQILSAFSAEYILTRIQLTHSILDTGKVIGAAHSFNGFKSDRTGGQIRSANRHASSAYFAENLKDESEVADWTARDILDYLVKYCKATGIGPYPAGVKNIELFIDMLTDDNYTPLEIPADGRTVYEILDDLFNASRGLAWQMVPRTGIESGFFIQVRSILHEAIDDVFGVSMSAAPVRVPFSIWSRRDVLSCRLRTDVSRKYDMVAVEGGPMGTVFTVSKLEADETTYNLPQRLEDGWTQEQREKYLVGAKDVEGYNDFGFVEKTEKNDAIRTADDLATVYRYYQLTEDFDRKQSHQYDEGFEYLFPKLSNSGTIDLIHTPEIDELEPQDQWFDVMRVEPYLPLIDSYDYSTFPVTKNENGSQSFRRPMTYLLTNRGTSVANIWIDPANQTHSVLDNERINVDFSVSTQPDDNGLALWISPNRLPHCLQTKFDFDLAEEPVKNVGVSSVQARTGFSPAFVTTVYVRSSNNVLVTYPETVEVESNHSSVLVLRLRNHARVDVMNTRTVIGVDNEQLKRSRIPTEILRDDRPKMLQLAIRAYRWYAAPRASIDIKLASLSSELSVGHVITRFDYGAPQRIRTQNNTIISQQGSSSGPPTVSNTLFGTQDGAALINQAGVLLANYSETSTPGPTTDGATITRQATHSRYVNTVVSRIVYDFQNMTTAIQTQFMEFNLARVFSDE